jgi:hypothetical protein
MVDQRPPVCSSWNDPAMNVGTWISSTHCSGANWSPGSGA